jgi:hypothetical protein
MFFSFIQVFTPTTIRVANKIEVFTWSIEHTFIYCSFDVAENSLSCIQVRLIWYLHISADKSYSIEHNWSSTCQVPQASY